MTPREIARLRLHQQQIAASRFTTPGGVVSAFGAMQAQDYVGALWTVGVRLPGATEAGIEKAVAQRQIVRTWPMRGTLHFVAAADVRWMLELLTPRILAGSARRRAELELDDVTFTRCRKLFVRALAGGRQLTREAMYGVLEKGAVMVNPHRGYHILWRLSQERFLCFGAREGKQPTFVLFEEWLPGAKSLEREASLAELARRYFTSHGPATLQDFSWWSGLKMSDARVGTELASARLSQEKSGGKAYWMAPDVSAAKKTAAAHLLSGFDEYLLGYQDRSAVLDPKHAAKIIPGNNGIFMPTLVVDGQVAGTWKRVVKKGSVTVSALPFEPLGKGTMRAFAGAAERYGKFLGLPVELK